MAKKIKLTVKNDVTSCSQLRVRWENDKEWTNFVAGIDLSGHVLILNSPPVFAQCFKHLVERMLFYGKENYWRAMEFVICDDTKALISQNEDNYLEVLDKKRKETAEKLNPYRGIVFHGLTYNSEKNVWEGEVTLDN